MKILTLARVAVLLLTVLAVSPTAAKAEAVCGPDTCTASYSGSLRDTLTLSGGCKVEIRYRFRSGCATYEYSLDSIRPLTPCSHIAVQRLWDTSAALLVLKNPIGFPEPGMDSCVTYRVNKPACARPMYRWNFGADTVHASCNVNACCRGLFVICRNQALGKYISSSQWAQFGTCNPQDSDCVDICIQTAVDPRKRVGGSGAGVESTISAVFPNPATDMLLVELSITGPVRGELSVYDQEGKMISSVSVDADDAGVVTSGFRTADWPSGRYVVVAELGGQSPRVANIIVQH